MSPINGVSQFEDMKSTEPMIRVLKAEKGTSKDLKFVNLLTPQLKESKSKLDQKKQPYKMSVDFDENQNRMMPKIKNKEE